VQAGAPQGCSVVVESLEGVAHAVEGSAAWEELGARRATGATGLLQVLPAGAVVGKLEGEEGGEVEGDVGEVQAHLETEG